MGLPDQTIVQYNILHSLRQNGKSHFVETNLRMARSKKQ